MNKLTSVQCGSVTMLFMVVMLMDSGVGALLQGVEQRLSTGVIEDTQNAINLGETKNEQLPTATVVGETQIEQPHIAQSHPTAAEFLSEHGSGQLDIASARKMEKKTQHATAKAKPTGNGCSGGGCGKAVSDEHDTSVNPDSASIDTKIETALSVVTEMWTGVGIGEATAMKVGVPIEKQDIQDIQGERQDQQQEQHQGQKIGQQEIEHVPSAAGKEAAKEAAEAEEERKEAAAAEAEEERKEAAKEAAEAEEERKEFVYLVVTVFIASGIAFGIVPDPDPDPDNNQCCSGAWGCVITVIVYACIKYGLIKYGIIKGNHLGKDLLNGCDFFVFFTVAFVAFVAFVAKEAWDTKCWVSDCAAERQRCAALQAHEWCTICCGICCALFVVVLVGPIVQQNAGAGIFCIAVLFVGFACVSETCKKASP